MTEARVCLWFDGHVREAARFYCETFSDTRIDGDDTAPADNPSVGEGDEFVVTMTIIGIPAMLLNGGPNYPQTEAFSFQVATGDQAETDRLWTAITGNGGSEGQCGWCKDRWGVSWQIVPMALTEALADSDPDAARRSMQAMLQMTKIDIAAIEAARAGETA